jgi:hypothetical protein
MTVEQIMDQMKDLCDLYEKRGVFSLGIFAMMQRAAKERPRARNVDASCNAEQIEAFLAEMEPKQRSADTAAQAWDRNELLIAESGIRLRKSLEEMGTRNAGE